MSYFLQWKKKVVFISNIEVNPNLDKINILIVHNNILFVGWVDLGASASESISPVSRSLWPQFVNYTASRRKFLQTRRFFYKKIFLQAYYKHVLYSVIKWGLNSENIVIIEVKCHINNLHESINVKN